MEKVSYLVNFLQEYLVGKDLASVDTRLLQTFLKSSREGLQTTQTQIETYHSTIPQHNAKFLGFVSAMNEFAEKEPSISKVLQRAEAEHYLSIEDSLKINPDQLGMEGNGEAEIRRESNLSTEDCMINLQALSKMLEKNMFEYERIYGELIADLPDDPTGMRDSVDRVSSTHRKVEKLSSAISTRVLNFLNSYEDSMSKYQECSRGKLSKEVRGELETVGEYLTKTIGSDFYIERLTKIKMLLLDIKRKATEVVEIAEVVYLAQKVSNKMRALNKTGSANLDSPTIRNEHRITFDESSMRLPDSSQTKRSYTQREDKLNSGMFGIKSSFLLAANEWGLTPVQRKTFMHLVQQKYSAPMADSANDEFTIKEMIANIKTINPELDAEANPGHQTDEYPDYYDYFPHEKPLNSRKKAGQVQKPSNKLIKDDSSRGTNMNYYHDAMKEGFDPNMPTQTTINQSDMEQDESHLEGDRDTKYTRMLDPADSSKRKKRCCEGCNLI